MLFLVEWDGGPADQEAVIERFLETGGSPPEGVEVIGRWHSAATMRGVAIAEATDAVALGKWAAAWSDLLTLDITPVVDDAGLVEVVAR